MTNRTRILFVSPTSTNIYGAEKALYKLLECLPQDRFHISLLVLAPLDYDTKVLLKSMDVSIIEARFRGWCHFGDDAWHKWRRVARLVDNIRVAFNLSRSIGDFDVIYSNTTSSPIGALIGAYRQIPHIWHIHDHMALQGTYWRFDWPKSLTLKWAERNTERFICFSQATYDMWTQFIHRSKVVLINPGLITQSDLSFPREKLTSTSEVKLCIVGGITESKGQHEAIKALPWLLQVGLTPRLTLAGAADHDYKAFLLKLITDLGLEQYVNFVGYVNAFYVFDHSDVHLMCTRSESAPRVAIESMARGCPTIATDIDGVREFVIDGVTGLHYSPGNAQELAQKILQLWSDSSLYQRLSKEGIEFVRSRFMLDEYIARTVTLIEDVANGKQPPPQPHPDEAPA